MKLFGGIIIIRIIAEAGVNWANFDEALQYIERAALAKANYIKFQLFNEETIKDSPLKDKLKPYILDEIDLHNLRWKADACKIGFILTPMYMEAVDLADKYADLIKIRFKDHENQPLIKKAYETGKPLLISVPMRPLNAFDPQIQYLYCINLYPPAPEDFNFDAACTCDGFCYDDKTEVLTDSGFKLFSSVLSNDMIATLSATGVLEYQQSTEIIANDYNGNMLQFAGRNYDLCVTPNHSLYTRCRPSGKNRKNYGYRLIKAEHFIPLKSNRTIWNFKKDAIWIGNEESFFFLPKIERTGNTGRKPNYTESIKMDNWLEFLGWFVSEGWTCKSGNHFTVGIGQRRYVTEIEKCLDKLPFKYGKQHKNAKYDGLPVTNFVIGSQKQLFSYIHKEIGKNVYEKHVPSFIKSLSSRQIMIFLKTLFLGDGSFFSNGNFRQYWTVSSKLADDVQELLLKIGLAGSINFSEKKHLFTVTVNNDGMLNPEVVPPSIFNYSGKIYCVTVPNHLLYVRREGKVVWSGNSSHFPHTLFDLVFAINRNREEAYIEKHVMLNDFYEILPTKENGFETSHFERPIDSAVSITFDALQNFISELKLLERMKRYRM